METGKVPNELLQSLILDKIRRNRKEVIVRPGIGEDCSVVDFGEYVCVLSSDPVTGSVHDVGWLAVHVSCNDIASAGVEPIGLMVTILAPAGTVEEELGRVMDQIIEAAASIRVDIIGGHTEITTAVSRFVISTTALGRTPKGRMVTTAGAKPGDAVVLTKTAGLEGTAVIAHDKEAELTAVFGCEMIDIAKGFIHKTSVVAEGIAAGEFGVHAMHDVTEGGILGAAWEVAEASGTGIKLIKNQIPVAPETLRIAEYYGIDPLKLISSGSMMIACPDGKALIEYLAEEGVQASVVGEITGTGERILIDGTCATEIVSPGPDELYKVIK